MSSVPDYPAPFKEGDTLVLHKAPEDREEWPTFPSSMDKLLGKPLIVTYLVWFTPHKTWAFTDEASGFTFRAEWFDLAPKLSLEEKVIRKIKQLDDNWKQSQLKKGNVCAF